MMMTLTLALALAATNVGSEATAVEPTTAAKPEKPKKICRTTRTTGSTIGRRVCKTQEEWDGLARDGAEALDLMDHGYKQNVGADNPFGGRDPR